MPFLKSLRFWLLVAGFLLVVVISTAILVPQDTNPAYAVAIDFVNSAGRGEEEAALALLSSALQAYIQQECPDGRVGACVASYTPPEWGGFLNAVFRRAQPAGDTVWDILLLATYAEAQGFSGVCIYNRVEQIEAGWRVTAWSGWVSCDLPNAGLSGLARPIAPNRAP